MNDNPNLHALPFELALCSNLQVTLGEKQLGKTVDICFLGEKQSRKLTKSVSDYEHRELSPVPNTY